MSGDSSLYNLSLVSQTVPIRVFTVESFMASHKIARIDLLKVVAEGSELEILIGAERILPQIHFISVDGSAERGGAETLSSVTGYLESRGFILVSKSQKYMAAVFKNPHHAYGLTK